MELPNLLLLSNRNALQKAMDVIANNIANVNTSGFKREGIEFGTYMNRAGAASGAAPGGNLQFTVDRATYRDYSNGPITPTSNALDLAINGKGYFSVQTADGKTHYTRAGNFQMDASGNIVTLSGDKVMGEGNQPVNIPDTATEINVSGDGFVTARVDNGTRLAEIGKISVVKFDNEQDLQAEGGGLYTTTDAANPVDNGTRVVQGAIEESNVKAVTEITQMIDVMRSYEQSVGLMGQENSRMDDAISKLSKTTA